MVEAILLLFVFLAGAARKHYRETKERVRVLELKLWNQRALILPERTQT